VIPRESRTSETFSAATESNIGNVLSEQGDYENALVHLNRALEIDLKTVGPCHESVAATEDNIGCVLQSKGDYENALLRH
jgi:tetratricopeptide (TPR) repeat protein